MPARRRSLNPAQTLAAERLGLGWMAKDVAEKAGVSTKAVQRWRQRDDFKALIRQARLRVLEDHPTPTAVLSAALHATKKDGSPDWQMRVTAAKALLGSEPPGDTPEERVRETRIYIGEKSAA